MARSWRLPLGLLSASQALSQSISVFIMTLASVVGALLSSDPSLTTLPVAAVVFGTLVGLVPISRWMTHHGRRSGFRLGIGFGLAGSVLALVGLAFHQFWVFTLGHFLIGVQQGAFQYLRFAASEIVPQEHRSRGIALVLAGGVVAAFLGPWLAFLGRGFGLDNVAGLAYGPPLILYIVLIVLFVFIPALTAHTSEIPTPLDVAPPRSLSTLMTQPLYLQSLAGSSMGYALMILLMTDTPLAMQHMGHTSAEASWVIQWHVLGMFIPSFFTGSLVDRWGHRPILLFGLIALALDAITAVFFQGLWSFWLSLTLLGIGWNFLYIASTSRLTLTYRFNEKEKSQAAHDLLVFILATAATWSAGPLLQGLTWSGLHLWILPLLGATSLAVLWPTASRRNP